MNLILGNSGPTFATNIRAAIDPPFPEWRMPDGGLGMAQTRLREGIQALGPGHRLVWSIGNGHEILKDRPSHHHKITIDADGPFGPLPPLAYDIDLADFRETRDAPDGNLHFVRKALEKIEKKLPKPDHPVRVIVEDQDKEWDSTTPTTTRDHP